MKIKTEQLIQELTTLIQGHLNHVVSLQSLPESVLNARLSEDSWSVLECIEHLNRYGNFYLPEIEKRIGESRTRHAPVVKSGLLGNYFAQSMLPRQKLNKMKTFRNMNPIHSQLDKDVLNTFESQQKRMLDLLRRSNSIDLNKVKTGTSISKLIRLRLGDTFRFVIYHNERHIRQAERILTEVNKA